MEWSTLITVTEQDTWLRRLRRGRGFAGDKLSASWNLSLTTCSGQGDTHRTRRLLEPEPQTESGDRKAFTASPPPLMTTLSSMLNSACTNVP
ncbi:hypothetical protein cgR_5045 [Corynebacterium glutamicum R]|uniref:Uncharacterized protein n=1 Tax=Corynebacterium glutamicum (strain R) TaxID=340322 RepID=A0AB72VDA9_CORGB|nr:hypothetical protein cgR_5045 [Corynebacterium glutamicum R]